MFVIIWLFERLILTYFFLYAAVTLCLVVVAWAKARHSVKRRSIDDLERIYTSSSTPQVAFLVPAHNEAATIVESVRALTQQYYPRVEIVIVNDGSTDETLETLKASFGFVTVDVDVDEQVSTQPIRTIYEAPAPLGTRICRFLLVDKVQGGKADALNAALNVAAAPFVCTMDADTVLAPRALLQLMEAFLDKPGEVVAGGGQVGISNGNSFKDGRMVERALPASPLEMLQVVEYMRSFTALRTALASLGSLVILSGVFAVFPKSVLSAAGGFLTSAVTSKVAKEYTGARDTVAEDMEVIVRLRRYAIEHGLPGTVVFLPHPIAYSQAPRRLRDLAVQRERWYRGLAQTLQNHAYIMFRPRYGALGILALPYQFLFEFLGPIVELVGYLSLPVLFVFGYLRPGYVLLFTTVAILVGILLSILAVQVGLWTEEEFLGDWRGVALFQYRGNRSRLRLLWYAVLSMVGYRQLLLLFMMRGLYSFLRGKQAWGAIRREQFSRASSAGSADAR